ncbi:uncharacterized protein LOC111057565 [Nilaparvata lugens]|uniref:uncharacterized protein LOC111057565 n=1 Tax=Nilaparvata lugens TaxID=108931 RepID=UPI00193D44A7|nr:uncharacterized protein LOC111057565 [Nilaparvata lugens]
MCFKNLERSMQRAHHSANPETPRNLSEFAELIVKWNERYGLVNGERFFIGNFEEGANEMLVAIVTPIVAKLQPDCSLHMDGTFKCRPKEPKCSQLFVVMASQFGRAFPILWALMRNRNAASYRKLFDLLKAEMPALKPTIVMSDYEAGLKEAVKLSFPTSRHVGCWFHYTQSIQRKAKKIGIRPGDNDEWSMAKQLMAIALLPPSRAQEATDVLSLIYHTEKSRVLIDYFRKQWLGKVTPESFSVFKEPSRTNNAQESLNRCLNRLIKAQGNPWDFWAGIQTISIKEMNYFRNMSEGREGTRTLRTKWLLQDKNIKSAEEKLERGEMSISNFLSSMSHRVGVVDIANDDAEEEEAAVEHDLVSLGNLEEAPQQMEEAATAEVVAPQEDYAADEFFAKEVDESLKEFKTKPTNFNPESPFEMCSRRFVEEQKDDLMKDLENAEGTSPSVKVVCRLCTNFEATRVCLPCGHSLGCTECIKKLLICEQYLGMTMGDGSIEVFDQYPLPARCPICLCLIGKIQRVFN